MLTVDRARELLAYDPATGVLTWRVATSCRVKVGDTAGTLSMGYVRVGIDGRRYLAHRLAWLIAYGAWPERELDHINGDRTDNRMSNLREATHAENGRNLARRDNNSSGVPGVRFLARTGRWQAQLMIDGRSKHLGYFLEFDDAVAARRAGEQQYFGAFARRHGHPPQHQRS